MRPLGSTDNVSVLLVLFPAAKTPLNNPEAPTSPRGPSEKSSPSSKRRSLFKKQAAANGTLARQVPGRTKEEGENKEKKKEKKKKKKEKKKKKKKER